MRILVLLPRFPYPLDKGDKLRAYHQIAELSKRHEVYLFALSHTQVPHEHYDHLHTICTAVDYVHLHWWEAAWGVLKAFLAGKPLQLGYWTSRRARRAFAAWQRQVQPDVVYCQMVRTMPTAGNSSCRKVLDFQDALSLNTRRRMERSKGLLRIILKYEYRALQRTEQEALRTFDATTIICQTDKTAIAGGESIVIVPNGVDTEYFKVDSGQRTEERGKRKEENGKRKEESPDNLSTYQHINVSTYQHINVSTKYTVLFSGNMSYAPNVDAARYLVEEIMPLVWETVPHATVLLAGADPAPAVRALAAKGPEGKVTVSGRLPDIRTAYASARIFAAPMRIGSGMQNKLLEAMAMHLPCVTTTLAATPLGATAWEHLLVGDTATQLADLIVKLTTNELHDAVADGGRRFVLERHSWPAAVAPLEETLKK